ncbi:OmpA family protein [Lysobacter arvi]|uniref:OmpA family protein n=1 Tax=Lysobacter arvi TaxID=3038776 RepID=A0ABU1CIC2_9GAMM|nr:OmpA family protein [Lysobacter arvi]MDR0184692.1 OmpA family protein [Lysobacter arvi]
MFTIQRLSGAALTIAALALVTSCGTTTLSQVHDGQTDAPVWPAVEKANPLIPATVHPNVESLRKIAVGTPKLEVYRLIGHPMYREGMVGVHEWDYVFKFAESGTGEETTCQYKVLFDDLMLAKQSYWNPAECARFVGEPEAPKAVEAEPYVAAATEVSADFLFAFDSARLSPEAPAAIDAKVVEVLNKAERVESLRVIGYADRLGSAAYNLALSQRRAESVKTYLVSRGIPAEAILAEGRGIADPVKECAGGKSPAVIACLAPNRRVRIEVMAR